MQLFCDEVRISPKLCVWQHPMLCQQTALQESIFVMASVCVDIPACSGLKLPACGHVNRASASFGMGCMPEA